MFFESHRPPKKRIRPHRIPILFQVFNSFCDFSLSYVFTVHFVVCFNYGNEDCFQARSQRYKAVAENKKPDSYLNPVYSQVIKLL